MILLCITLKILSPTHLRQGELVLLERGHHRPESHHLRRLEVESLPQCLEVARHPADVELEGGSLDRLEAASKKRVLVGIRLRRVEFSE